LQPNAERVDRSVYSFVGPVLGDRHHQGSWRRPDDAEKVLLVSLGSAFTRQLDFYRRCVAAFGDLPGWHTVLQIGSHVDPAELGPVPDRVEIHPWIPQLAVLKQADAFVTHAGMGGSSEGLFCGTPMIAVPQAADQFANAEQLASLGVARVVDSTTVTAAELREALLALTADPAVAARSAELKRQAREAGGADRAADLIEAELAPGSVPPIPCSSTRCDDSGPPVGVASSPDLAGVVWSGCRRGGPSAGTGTVTVGEVDPGGGRRAGSAVHPAAGLREGRLRGP
jgi:MGT family glycosyltransferase